ncbi:hypothetical protein [Rhizobium laguerreae]|uniref:hypothetical protein n=1 Tax=Rhizobium laguerreae TaxID=1076926 RepID=UPI001C90B9A4|nr:hypothetical protein [Rhizobium laguerreae]
MECHGDFLRTDETIQPITGSELDFDVFRSFWQGIVAGSTAISCIAEDETIDDVLAAEAVQLQVHDIFEGEGDDCVLVEHAIAILINSVGANPAENLQLADASAIETECPVSAACWAGSFVPNELSPACEPDTASRRRIPFSDLEKF